MKPVKPPKKTFRDCSLEELPETPMSYFIYSSQVLKARLPDPYHAKMVSFGREDFFVKSYLDSVGEGSFWNRLKWWWSNGNRKR